MLCHVLFFQHTETTEKTWVPTKADLEADAKEKN